ncbi:hypothetical protein [Polyangium spumosum]|uniref:PLD phosphodiesterase domain-containing protein n=1 Tax=Polyangium spumosum TaxID=889282 RepID=A0A6N7Q236_9BACT|nr:hypothetical protein [Polyangium spumosum]MRG96870.1 hypothetical protein [Polyangium spumosum]
MQSPIPENSLCDALRDAIGKGRVEAAVFTTYTFEPAFFEENVLPVLWDKTFSHHTRARMCETDRALREGIAEVAVYYDRAGLQQVTSPRLAVTYRAIVRRNKTRFHPKVVLALVTDGDGAKRSRRLVICISSANLTEPGYFTSLECFHIEEVAEGTKCSFRDDLRHLLRNIRSDAPPDDEHPALDEIDKFARGLQPDERKKTRIFVGQSTLTEFFAETLVRGVRNRCELEIVSPYFDESDAAPLRALAEALSPTEIRVYLPTDENGKAACSEAYFEAVEDLATWSDLPAQHRRSSEKDSKAKLRRVHAKLYRLLLQDGREYSLVGSVNLTGAAHESCRQGNLEAAFLVLDKYAEGPRPLLTPLGRSGRPKIFADPEEVDDEEDIDDVIVLPLYLRYDWGNGMASYYWDEQVDAVPRRISVTSGGVPITVIAPVQSNAWVPFRDDVSRVIAEKLRGTSYLTAQAGERGEAIVLVQEIGIIEKPSYAEGVQWTAEDILRAWSSLSEDQRQIALERSLEATTLGSTVGRVDATSKDAEKSLFDGVAGIYHGFFRLEDRVVQAIQDKRPREAEFLLFGKGFDTLPALLDRVIKDDAGDRVHRYVTLLSVQVLFDRFDRLGDVLVARFLEEHAKRRRELEKKLGENVDTIRATFTFEDAEHRRRFFAWFDRWFRRNVERGEHEEDRG